jgi:hypothetical protein
MFHSFPSRVNAWYLGRRLHVAVNHMLLWITFILSINHIDPVRQSQSIHAPRLLLRTELSHLHSFYERPMSSQCTIVDRSTHCASNQVGQRFSDTYCFLPSRKKVATDFSSPSRCCCRLDF